VIALRIYQGAARPTKIREFMNPDEPLDSKRFVNRRFFWREGTAGKGTAAHSPQDLVGVRLVPVKFPLF
jgi:hypothetical protein